MVYQLRIFARRNKALFSAIAAVFVVLLGGVIVIQCLSLVIANPILGRPIAFTPRVETFYITLALFTVLGLLIWGIVLLTKRCIGYVKTNWTEQRETIVNRPEPDSSPESKVEQIGDLNKV